MEVEGVGSWPSRRPLSTLVETGEVSSSSRKRFRFSFSDDDDSDFDLDDFEAVSDDGSHGQDDGDSADDDGDEEAVDEDDEGEQQIQGEIEYSPLDVYCFYHHLGDAVEDQQDEEQTQQGGRGRGEDQPLQPPAEEEADIDDDHRPIRLVHRCSTAPAQTQAPAVAPPVATPAPPDPSRSSCSDSSSSIMGATVENNGTLDCGICYQPLKPPIFQCSVGHVVCSRCSDKLGEASNCHKCRAPMPDGYRRSYDMENLVNAIRVPCPHAARGCGDRPVYHDRDAHARACPHAPTCHCPGEACGFAGTTEALVDHFASVHGWPCTSDDEDEPGGRVFVSLRDGFNFVTAVRAAAADQQGTPNKYLFLLNVVRAPPYGRTITAFCIRPDHTATAKISLTYSRGTRDDMCDMHLQMSDFKVVCTDLSNGLPDPSRNCFLFVVPGSGSEEEDDTITVRVQIISPPPIQ